VSNLALEEKYINYAHSLLVIFVTDWKKLYGHLSVVYNVHGLLHISEDARKYGPLDSFSAFKFEIFLGKIKRKIRSPVKPMEQFINRCSEQDVMSNLNSPKLVEKTSNILRREYANEALHRGKWCKIFKEIVQDYGTICNSKPNNCVTSKKLEVIIVTQIIQEMQSKKILLAGYKFLKQEDFYQYPCLSSDIGIYRVDGLSTIIQYWGVDEIKWKCACYPDEKSRGFVSVPLIHSIL
jgi:hypothetical protein